jgi:hypothetical protein
VEGPERISLMFSMGTGGRVRGAGERRVRRTDSGLLGVPDDVADVGVEAEKDLFLFFARDLGHPGALLQRLRHLHFLRRHGGIRSRDLLRLHRSSRRAARPRRRRRRALSERHPPQSQCLHPALYPFSGSAQPQRRGPRTASLRTVVCHCPSAGGWVSNGHGCFQAVVGAISWAQGCAVGSQGVQLVQGSARRLTFHGQKQEGRGGDWMGKMIRAYLCPSSRTGGIVIRKRHCPPAISHQHCTAHFLRFSLTMRISFFSATLPYSSGPRPRSRDHSFLPSFRLFLSFLF